jgi:mono/diheme cytochrome c family protein
MIRQSKTYARRVEAKRVMLRAAAILAVCGAPLLAAAAYAQSNPSAPKAAVFSPGFRFVEPDGESLYRQVCSACHMTDGKGASGAGTFPSLANDSRLQASGYPLHVVTNGLHGMPPLGAFMNDEQVAAVVNYVRTHFGNDYQDAVTAADAKAARPSGQGGFPP